jgi:hypothetical protein
MEAIKLFHYVIGMAAMFVNFPWPKKDFVCVCGIFSLCWPVVSFKIRFGTAWLGSVIRLLAGILVKILGGRP